MSYSISFLWFDNLAEASLSFERQADGTFQAVLEARTMGVAAWLTGHRRQRYAATMELCEGGSFRTRKYESFKLKGKGKNTRIWTKSYTFDYRHNKIDYTRLADGRMSKHETFSIEERNPPADILTTLYNFRRGVYGQPSPGVPLIVGTFAGGKKSEIRIDIVPPSSNPDHAFLSFCRPLYRVTLDADVFDTGGGDVYVCFDKDGRPWKGVVENVLGMGDVRGHLKGTGTSNR